MPTNYLATDTDLTAVANAIRTKARISGGLIFPSGFVSGINGISEKAAAVYNTSSSDQTIAAKQYLAGAQTIKAVTTSNIAAGNIKAGVNVKVGDANNTGRIANVTGTFTSDANAAASDMLDGKIAYVNGNKVTGNIPSKAAENFWTSTGVRRIAAGRYISGEQYIAPVETSGIAAEYIKKGARIRVGDSNNYGRIKDVIGAYISDFTYVSTGQVKVYLSQKTAETIYSRRATSFAVYSTRPVLGDYNVIAAGITSEDQIIALVSFDAPTIYSENGTALGLACYTQCGFGNGHTRADGVMIRAVNLTNDTITYPGGNCYVWTNFYVYYHPDAL